MVYADHRFAGSATSDASGRFRFAVADASVTGLYLHAYRTARGAPPIEYRQEVFRPGKGELTVRLVAPE